ncbi:hypothetical protein MLD38_028197 [Melastoma candidum]|uniref:Uncharacterized protein n=1 Tax=Melastoma candidum TaxID=119954 RepID=A0ACB9N0E5_9MYRT|nr:hypothetical protein MLD38_028197 [Melastoma candidum]
MVSGSFPSSPAMEPSADHPPPPPTSSTTPASLESSTDDGRGSGSGFSGGDGSGVPEKRLDNGVSKGVDVDDAEEAGGVLDNCVADSSSGVVLAYVFIFLLKKPVLCFPLNRLLDGL